MTDDHPTPTDRHGNELGPGDTVEFVYGGEWHEGAITSVEYPTIHHPHVTTRIKVTVPAPSVALVHKHQEKTESTTTTQTNPPGRRPAAHKPSAKGTK